MKFKNLLPMLFLFFKGLLQQTIQTNTHVLSPISMPDCTNDPTNVYYIVWLQHIIIYIAMHIYICSYFVTHMYVIALNFICLPVS